MSITGSAAAAAIVVVGVFPFNTESFICWCCAIVTAVCLFIHFHLNHTTQLNSTQLTRSVTLLLTSCSHLILSYHHQHHPHHPHHHQVAASKAHKISVSAFVSAFFFLFERPHRWLLSMRMDRRYKANSVFPFQVPATYLSFNRNIMKLMKWHFYRKPVQTRTFYAFTIATAATNNCTQNSINNQRLNDIRYV